MKKYLLILFVAAMPFFGLGQRINAISIDQLNERINKGNDTTYIINFWATWCGPCVKELPAFEQFGQTIKTSKTKVLLISLDFKSELKTAVLPFIKNRNLQSEVLLLDEKDPQEYINRIDSSWSGAIPTTLFLNKRKHVLFEKDFSYDELITAYNNFKADL